MIKKTEIVLTASKDCPHTSRGHERKGIGYSGRGDRGGASKKMGRNIAIKEAKCIIQYKKRSCPLEAKEKKGRSLVGGK